MGTIEHQIEDELIHLSHQRDHELFNHETTQYDHYISVKGKYPRAGLVQYLCYNLQMTRHRYCMEATYPFIHHLDPNHGSTIWRRYITLRHRYKNEDYTFDINHYLQYFIDTPVPFTL